MEDVAKAGGFEKHRIQKMHEEVKLKKMELEILKELRQISREQWTDIKESTHNLRAIVEGGGVDQVITDFKSHVTGALNDSIEGALAPLKNEISMLIAEALAPIFTLLNDVSNDLANFIAGNTTGALIGGIVGAIKGPIGAIVGAIVGAYFEELWTRVPEALESGERDWWEIIAALFGVQRDPALEDYGETTTIPRDRTRPNIVF